MPAPLHDARHTRLIIAAATIIIGISLGTALSVLLVARSASIQDCMTTEMKGQPPEGLPHVQRLCAERQGVHLPDRWNSN
jgi:hypothetical protein